MLVQLLTAQCLIDSSITLLRCRLDSKNMKALKFICGDLKLIPFKPKVLMDQSPQVLQERLDSMPFGMGEYQLYWYLPLLMLFPKWKSKPYPLAGGHMPKLATPELMQQIQDIIKDTTVPSWINSVLQFNLVRVEICELRPEGLARGDGVLIHYRSRTNKWWGLSSKTYS